MVLEISRYVLIGIRQISAAAAPREACGLLFGRGGVIDAFQAVENVSETPERTFEIDPRALFAALKAERAGGPEMIGYWHSHPSGDPRPSATDAAMAQADGKLWLIVAAGGMALWRPVEQDVFGWSDGDPRAHSGGTRIGFHRVPLVTDDIRDLLPHTKSDVEMVPLLAEAGYPAVAPYLDDLLGWTHDPNWPIAGPMAEWLATLGAPMLEPLRRVLHGEDGDAKVNCLWGVARYLAPEVRAGLVGDLRALAERPSEKDRLEEADACARELLAEWRVTG
ncbi:Mov34/MPN/PAD-1 family protein [Sphingomonas kyeonggiensis]|uniref:Mov34/MPN/PAD-1 family protein n=1 Tax=Sphingomonas kyeonggiensis TaxID=1268553 RepID=UPI0027D88A19|nr:Mov34/MPN/PAD-1 family protein [Sphingomonas kyeonggiensis]